MYALLTHVSCFSSVWQAGECPGDRECRPAHGAHTSTLPLIPNISCANHTVSHYQIYWYPRPELPAICMPTQVYMGTENSSAATRQRAALLASQIGAFHYHITIDLIVQAVLTVFAATTTRAPKYISQVPRYPKKPLDTDIPQATRSWSAEFSPISPPLALSICSRLQCLSCRRGVGLRRTWRCRTFRRGSVWSWPTSLRSSRPGCADDRAFCSCSAAPTSTRHCAGTFLRA